MNAEDLDRVDACGRLRAFLFLARSKECSTYNAKSPLCVIGSVGAEEIIMVSGSTGVVGPLIISRRYQFKREGCIG